MFRQGILANENFAFQMAKEIRIDSKTTLLDAINERNKIPSKLQSSSKVIQTFKWNLIGSFCRYY